MRNHELVILACDIIVDPAGWRIEYKQQGVQVKHRLNATTRDMAIKEAMMQGFTKISVWRTEYNALACEARMINDGTVVVPKYAPLG